MKKLIFIALLFTSFQSYGQLFPTKDSLENYIRRYVKNSAVESFTNLRLQNVLIGLRQYLDSTSGGQVYVDTIFKVGDTLKYKINGVTNVVGVFSSGTSTDTTSLSNRINLKLNISDTATMLAPYLRSNIAAATYQPTLVSGTNIKTINGNSLLGSGDLTISGSNIYNSNGTLTGNRQLTLGGNSLSVLSGTNTAFHLFSNGRAWFGNGSPVDGGSQVDINGAARVNSLSFRDASGDATISIVATAGSNAVMFKPGLSSSNITFSRALAPSGFWNFRYRSDGSTDAKFLMASAETNTFVLQNTALLELRSTTQGFLPPRMTAAQASAISSPAEGLMVYVTDTNGTFTQKGWWGFNGSTWERLNN